MANSLIVAVCSRTAVAALLVASSGGRIDSQTAMTIVRSKRFGVCSIPFSPAIYQVTYRWWRWLHALADLPIAESHHSISRIAKLGDVIPTDSCLQCSLGD
jgi:hypothetical protein